MRNWLPLIALWLGAVLVAGYFHEPSPPTFDETFIRSSDLSPELMEMPYIDDLPPMKPASTGE